jgi:enoyl-CoA hydratase/carnithine racemase
MTQAAELRGAHVIASAQGRSGRLTLASPAKRNALSAEFADEVVAGLAFLADHGVQVGVLDAAGPAFCAGVDLSLPITAEPGTPDLEIFAAFLGSPIVWIASVDGPALAAGMVLAALCPVTLATERAWFGLPEVRLGIFPGRVTGYLDAVLPRRALMALALTGERIDASTAAGLGLVTDVVTSAGLRVAEAGWVTRLLGADPAFLAAAAASWAAQFTAPEVAAHRAENDRLLAENIAALATGDRP